MAALKRRDGIVWIQPYGVVFPMLDPATRAHVTCVQTLAGFEKILGRKNFRQEEMRVLFHKNRADFELFAGLVFGAHAGDALSITITPAPEGQPAEAENRS